VGRGRNQTGPHRKKGVSGSYLHSLKKDGGRLDHRGVRRVPPWPPARIDGFAAKDGRSSDAERNAAPKGSALSAELTAARIRRSTAFSKSQGLRAPRMEGTGDSFVSSRRFWRYRMSRCLKMMRLEEAGRQRGNISPLFRRCLWRARNSNDSHPKILAESASGMVGRFGERAQLRTTGTSSDAWVLKGVSSMASQRTRWAVEQFC